MNQRRALAGQAAAFLHHVHPLQHGALPPTHCPSVPNAGCASLRPSCACSYVSIFSTPYTQGLSKEVGILCSVPVFGAAAKWQEL